MEAGKQVSNKSFFHKSTIYLAVKIGMIIYLYLTFNEPLL